MIKKLSATFRRNKSAAASPVDMSTSSATDSDDALSQLTNAYQRVLQEQNRQVAELQRLRSMNEGVPSASVEKHSKDDLVLGTSQPPSGRSKTFSGESIPHTENTIPFFQEPPSAPSTPSVLSVRGTPAWRKAKPGKSKPPRPARRQATAPSMEPSYDLGSVGSGGGSRRRRQTSFSAAEASLSGASYIGGGGVKSTKAGNGGFLGRVRAGKRWKSLRRGERYNHLPGDSKETITQRRDRVEALPLATACAHLESELFRLAEVRERDDECENRIALNEAAERISDVLSILEDRFDTIEEYYVKGKEYARAMGRFYDVSPSEYTKWTRKEGRDGRLPLAR